MISSIELQIRAAIRLRNSLTDRINGRRRKGVDVPQELYREVADIKQELLYLQKRHKRESAVA